MYGYYYYDSSYIFYVLISLAVSLYAHFKVRHAFNKYSKIGCLKSMTGEESARAMLEHSGVKNVTVERTQGYFTDFFDSRRNGIFLSDNVYSKSTVAAVSVAAHEAGHAVQRAKGYFPIKIREILMPVTQIGSNLAMPLVFIGLMLPVQYNFIVKLGILFFSLAVLFQIVTLPVEFNASARALKFLKEANIFTDEEIPGAKKVLAAAALTYVAATFTALLSLLRLIMISRRRD